MGSSIQMSQHGWIVSLVDQSSVESYAMGVGKAAAFEPAWSVWLLLLLLC
jgi:hypothetical protein